MAEPHESAEGRWKRLMEVFDGALEVDAAERENWVAAACGGDEALRQEAMGLLAAAEAEKAAAEAAPAEPTATGAGLRYGAWETVRTLGAGGMGTVFLVRRADGEFEQQGALKLIAPHLAGEYFLERFRTERQILAHLNHPNITKLIDGGVEAGGAPYLVMEFVDGVPLDRFADEHRLPVEARLRLFLKVCDAVEFAHRNLIVHRDLKPGNILVDSLGEPKLLDFGTARLIPQAAGDAVTQHRFVTPRYASPEALHRGPVTTQTDVFSLGVLLYEQITGARPFGDDSTPPSDILRRVTSGEIAPPQSMITDSAARVRSVTPRELRRLAGGDLARILEKATRAGLDERYASVADFAADLRAYLDGRPVKAQPPSFRYTARKYLRRHWRPVTAGVVMVLGLAGAALFSQRQARLAERRLRDLRDLANYLVFDIHNGLQRLPGSTPLQRETVERALAYLDGLAAEAGGDRPLHLQLAEGYLKLADVLGNPYRASLGENAAALRTYTKASEALAPLVSRDPRDAEVRRLSAAIRIRQGGVRGFGGGPAAGMAQIEQAAEDLRALVREYPQNVRIRLDLAAALEFQANRIQSGGGEIETAESRRISALYREARGHLNELFRVAPSDSEATRQMAVLAFSEAVQWGSSDPAKSLRMLRESLGWLEKMPRQAKESIELRRLRAAVLLNTGWAEGQLREYPAALASITRAEETLQALAAVDPANVAAQYQMTGVYRSRGIVHGYAGQNAAAIADFLKAAELHARLLEKEPENTVYRFLRADLLIRAGNLLASAGQAAAAEQHTGEGLKQLRGLADREKPSVTHLFGACRWLVETRVARLRDPAAAAGYCRQGAVATEGKDPDAWLGLSAALELMGDRDGAAEAAGKALALVPPPAPGQPPSRQRLDTEANWKRLRR